MNLFMNKLFDRVSYPFILLWALPTWSIAKLLVRHKPNHPWHPFTIQLQDWAFGRTNLCKVFDFAFWYCPIVMVGCIYRIGVFHGWWS